MVCSAMVPVPMPRSDTIRAFPSHGFSISPMTAFTPNAVPDRQSRDERARFGKGPDPLEKVPLSIRPLERRRTAAVSPRACNPDLIVLRSASVTGVGDCDRPSTSVTVPAAEITPVRR